jgi:exopolysaccharide production protein ExoZ
MSPGTDPIPTTGKHEFYPGLQSLRGWATLCVLLYHTHVLFRKEKYFGYEMLGGLFEFGHRGVDLFFVLSGFLMAMLTQPAEGRRVTAGRFLAARARRIYLPFLPVFAGLTSACFFSRNVCPAAYAFDAKTLLMNALILPRDNLDTFVPVVAWTLAHELFFYLMAWASLLVGRRGPWMLALWVAASLLLALSGVQLAFPWSFLLSPYNVAFGLGLLAYRLATRWPAAQLFRSPALLAGGAALFVAFGLVESFTDAANRPAPGLALTLGFFCASFLLVLGFIRQAGGAMLALGSASYSVYLVHYPLLVVLCMAASRMLKGVLPLPVLFVVVAALALVGGALYYRLVERPALRLFSFGGKP